MANLNKRRTSVSSRVKDSRISSKKLNIKNLDNTELLSTIFKKRTKKSISTKFPATLNGDSTKKVKYLPELEISVEDNWKEIYKRDKVLNVRVFNAGQSAAYNAFFEIYTTPTELIRRGASLTIKGHFQKRTVRALETIYPGKEILIPIRSPGYSLYGTLFEPYFFMCYDILQDPKVKVEITESTNELEEYLINIASENRKLLFLEPILSPTIKEVNPKNIRMRDYSRLRKMNLRARR